MNPVSVPCGESHESHTSTEGDKNYEFYYASENMNGAMAVSSYSSTGSSI